LLLAALTAGCKFHVDRTLPPGEISGTVTLAPSPGQKALPVAFARVTLEGSSLKITADAHGNFALVGLPAGTYALDISPPSSNPLAGSVGLHIGGLTLAPLPGGQLSGFDLGTVTLNRLGGIAGTVIESQQPVTGASAVLPGLGHATSTDGAFSFVNVLPGDYSLTVVDAAASGGARVSAPQKVKVLPGAITQVPVVDLTSVPVVTTGALSGQVQLSGQTSSKGVSLMLQGLTTTFSTDDSGNYSQANIPANVYTLTATAPGFQSAMVPGIIVAGPATMVPLILLAPVPMTPVGSTADAGVSPQQINPYTLGSASFVSQSPNYQLSTVSGTALQVEASRNFQFVPGPIALSTGGTP
jgi:hypothetical protein